MRALVWLVVGMTVGIGIGWLLGQDSAHPLRSERTEVQGQPRAFFDSQPSRSRQRPLSATAQLEPQSPRRETEDDPLATRPDALGTLIVECDGTRITTGDVSVYAMDMWGEDDEATPEDEPEEHRAIYRLWPGETSVAWYDQELMRVRVTIRAGETTIVSTDGPRRAEDDPVPSRLGRLIVSIHDIDGRPVADGSFELIGRGASGMVEEPLEVDGTGRTALDLKPGPYRIVVGAQTRMASLTAGRTTRVEFRSENEGEVEFKAPGPGGCWLQIPGEVDGAARPRFAIGLYERNWRMLYVLPGTYDFFFQGNGESRARNLGRVHVSARMRTKVRASLPSGTVHVRLLGLGTEPITTRAVLDPLDSDDAPGRIHRVPSFAPKLTKSSTKYPCSVVFDHLPAGRWRLNFRPPGFRPVTRDIEIDGKPIEITIEMRRS